MYDDRNGLNNYQGFTPNEQNYNQPMSVIGADYKSPWDFNTLPTVNHYFEYLGRSYGKGYIRVTPYIGLAYYDGADDGVYNTPIGSFNLASGGYPNLFNNNLEAGNYIEANPIVLGENTYSTHELVMWPDPSGPQDHCQVRQVQGGPTFLWNPEGIFFNLMLNDLVQPQALVGIGTAVTPTASATLQERNLLARFGKVFYYKIEIGGDDPNVYFDTVYISALEITQADLTNGIVANDILPIGYQDQPFRGDLYVINGFREIVVDMSTTPSSGLNMHINNFPTQPYTDSFGKVWFFDTNITGRISGLSLYIY